MNWPITAKYLILVEVKTPILLNYLNVTLGLSMDKLFVLNNH